VQCGKCLPEGSLALALRWWTGLPYSVFVHGEELSFAAESRELTFLTGRVLRGAATLIANSHNTARLLTGTWGVRSERVKVLHPGVDTTRFVPAPRDAAARDRLGWGGRPVVLTVGRLVSRKGQDMMIRALPAVRRRVPDVLYAVIGDGEERANLETLADREGVRGHVQFLGEVPDDEIIRGYQQCDLFALPNRQVGPDIEGFGMVLLEAQACGRPVLAGASGGTAETMTPGQTGVVVPCEAPEPLAAAVADLLADPARLDRMGAAGRRWAVEQFDWEALADRAARLFLPGRVPVAEGAAS
jgi:phosphatidylinositol alpha-1,6-mannosyltransferase